MLCKRMEHHLGTLYPCPALLTAECMCRAGFCGDRLLPALCESDSIPYEHIRSNSADHTVIDNSCCLLRHVCTSQHGCSRSVHVDMSAAHATCRVYSDVSCLHTLPTIPNTSSSDPYTSSEIASLSVFILEVLSCNPVHNLTKCSTVQPALIRRESVPSCRFFRAICGYFTVQPALIRGESVLSKLIPRPLMQQVHIRLCIVYSTLHYDYN